LFVTGNHGLDQVLTFPGAGNYDTGNVQQHQQQGEVGKELVNFFPEFLCGGA